MHENEISDRIIGAAIEVHRALGPGLLESVYEECLAAEMEVRGIAFERQRPVPLVYRQIKLDCGYRVDFVVENKVVLELKSLDVVPPVMFAQVLTYVRLLDLRLGLLVNFNVSRLSDGVKRLANNLR